MDTYSVDLIHFHNPHLMWIEIINNRTELKFEQVGIYGILPRETTIDIDSNSLESHETNKWLPAAATLIKQFLSDSTEIWFTPTHIDRRVSIFDDNIHKYGDFTIKKKGGKLKKLSKLLIKSGFAYSNEALFYENLISGKIQNRLENYEILGVISEFARYYKAKDLPNKYWEMALKKQMSVFEFGQQLESTLTESNLQKHNKLMVLKNKLKDFEMCKDIEEDSLGRANKNNKGQSENNVASDVIQNKKCNIIIQTYNCMKKFLDENSKEDESMKIDKNRKENLKDDNRNTSNTENLKDTNNQTSLKTQDSKYSENIDDEQIYSSNESWDCNDKVVCDKKKKCRSTKVHNENFGKNIPYSAMNTHKQLNDATKSKNKFKDDENNPHMYKDNVPNWKNNSNNIIEMSIKSNRLKKLSRTSTHVNRIAYGPPDLAKCKLKLKAKEVITEDLKIQKPIEDKVEKEHCDIQLYEIDSEIDIDISNKIALKETFNKAETENRLLSKSPNIMRKEERNSSSSRPSLLQKKLRFYETIKNYDSFSSSDTSNKDSSINEEVKHFLPFKKCESEKDTSAVNSIINKEYNFDEENVKELVDREIIVAKLKTNVNPFQNIDASISVFVDKLVKPILMVHSKLNSRIEPLHEMRDIPFNAHIQGVLKNMSIKRPMMLQTVSWFTILRGYSLFMISPKDSGKTLGYLPAVCRLVIDYNDEIVESVGPVAIIVCATVESVSHIETMAKILLGSEERVLSCFAGVEKTDITTSLLNGCDLLITTPCLLVSLMQDTEFGVDLRRLCTFVIDDCERMSVVYRDELNIFMYKIKEMLKKRAHKELKVQFILASRVWCSFMESLAKKAPDTVICIGAFQECVLYSKANTSVVFVKVKNKMSHVHEFLNQIDKSKKTVIVCRYDEEVELVSRELSINNFTVFTCNNEMTVQDLHNINIAWIDYEEPLVGPILVCCDGNLIHMNVTNAHNLIHFSMPPMFSMFCKRFSVLIDHYPSIFKSDNETIKIKILLDDSTIDQMPKIINFAKRCTDNIPDVFDEICSRVCKEKNVVKAKSFVPICNGMLSFGYCSDFYNCQMRHALLKEYDTPQQWMPSNGLVTFTIIHCHTAAFYSARLRSHLVNGVTTEFRQNYRPLIIRLGLYYSKESNRKLHGIPQLGDICAVMKKQNLFMRCEVINIINRYQNGNPNCLLVMLIDEKKIETTRDIYLFHLPDDLKKEETYAVEIRVANIQPKDKDITYSKLARDHVRKITESDNDIYIRGHISMSIKNCIFVDSLEVCHDLPSFSETVVRYNVRQELLDHHAVTNPNHISQLQEICLENNFILEENSQISNAVKNIKTPCISTWAHLESHSDCGVYFLSAISPDKFFVFCEKFESCLNDLIKEIQQYAVTVDPLLEVQVGEVLLAKFPDDATYERARVDEINKDRVRCFFVDQGDWRDVPSNHLLPITEKFVNKMPFQAIECRLVGIRPPGNDWTDLSTNWLCNFCFDTMGNLKHLFVKYLTKEPAEFTRGHKYSVILTDTNSEHNVIINQLMIDLNLAREKEDELNYLNLNKETEDLCTARSLEDEEWEKVTAKSENKYEISPNKRLQQPIRSVPLIGSDEESENSDKWEMNMLEDIIFTKNNIQKNPRLLAIDENEFSNTPKQVTQSRNDLDISREESIDRLISTKSQNKNGSDMSPVDPMGCLKVMDNENQINSDISQDNTTDCLTVMKSKNQIDSDISPENTTDCLTVMECKNQIDSDISQENTTDCLTVMECKNQIDLDISQENTTDCLTVMECKNQIDLDISQENTTDFLIVMGRNDLKVKEIDSDDITSPESPKVSMQIYNNKVEQRKRLPKLLWHQTKNDVIVKIQLIGAEYRLSIKERALIFTANANDTEYGFEIKLYGIIDESKCSHENKGLYILVKLVKYFSTKWLTLTADVGIQKWILYDVDYIDTSSDEEELDKESLEHIVRNTYVDDSESEDEEFKDDLHN